MTHLDIAHLRLQNQHITQQTFAKPCAVVQWLGAVQAQDYGAAKWAVGLRLQDATDNTLEQAFNSGEILRTHVMRPTWHFVAPADIRWLLALTAPHVKATIAYYDRQLAVDNAVLSQSNTALTKALQGGRQLTRQELVSVLQQVGTASDNLQRFGHILMHAELDGIICSGARRGKQFTYALLDERVPQTGTFTREEALAALAQRYFTSHGPATMQDFVWWSGLPVADAKAALSMVTSQLLHEVVDEQTYWFSPSNPPEIDVAQTAHLLPNFDEYTVGYTDRSAVFDMSLAHKLDARSNSLLSYIMVLDGQVVGTWKRTIQKNEVSITPNLFTPLNETATRAFTAAATRYGAFLQLSVHIAFPMEEQGKTATYS